MKVLVCGGRNYSDAGRVEMELDRVSTAKPITLLVHGGATGADQCAELWACRNGIHTAKFAIERRVWKRHGKAAGPMRNRLMLCCNPDLVLAFPGGRGTANMVKLAREAGVPVREIRAETQEEPK